MKRDIKFRGKCLDNGEWIYSSLVIINGRTFIFSDDIFQEVDPSTVGQYTGLKDKNGREIYEGDIVRNLRRNTEEICYFHSKFACFCFQERIGYDEIHYYQKCDEKVLEVIGNIYDNPELLEDKE